MTDGLERLAAAHGVSTTYEDGQQVRRAHSPESVRAVLAALGVRAGTDAEVEDALREVEDAPWRSLAPPVVTCLRGRRAAITTRVPLTEPVRAVLEREDGVSVPLAAGQPVAQRDVDGVARVAYETALPNDLPTGYHRVVVEAGSERGDTLVVVAPGTCPDPAPAAAWGWMVQLYALRSSASWGIGDLGDLTRLASWSGPAGASFVLCNPLHAATLSPPIDSSPYYPSSRRFANPLYLAVEELPEFAAAPPAFRRRLQRLASDLRAHNPRDDIDRDRVWAAKHEALELLRSVPPARDRRAALRRFQDGGGAALRQFALFCALVERHGASWREWPPELRHPDAPAVAAAEADLADRVAFHVWLQFCCDEQLAGAQRSAVEAGMALGVLSDLAVGVAPNGADAWALQDVLAEGMTVGAPPDPFNQQGQDWGLPPPRPDRLVAEAYQPWRELLAPALRHAGGVRIDHVLGLFRLWWIPEGAEPADGCYVSYPAGDLLAVLALEAERAGDRLVIGEDLGTVAPHIRELLDERGVFGSRVLYFERDEDGARLPAAQYPSRVLASVTTHDLPTVAGWWADEDLRVQDELGLLGSDTSLEQERRRKERDRAEMVALLVEAGLLAPEDADPRRLTEALHAFLARTSARLVAAQPADAIGDLRQPNQPGTTDEYPNWRRPIARPTRSGHRPVLLEELLSGDDLASLARILSEGRAATRAPANES